MLVTTIWIIKAIIIVAVISFIAVFALHIQSPAFVMITLFFASMLGAIVNCLTIAVRYPLVTIPYVIANIFAYPSNLGFVICLVVYVLVLKNVVTRDYHREIIACLEEAVREDIEIIGDGSLVKTYLEARAAMHSFMIIDRIICNSWDYAGEEKQFVAREYAKGNLEKRIVDGKVCYCRPLAKKQLKYWGQI